MEIINGERLVLGTCYYPEHWDESLWRDDLKRMLENGIEVIRIAEFAWSKIERYEGVFNIPPVPVPGQIRCILRHHPYNRMADILHRNLL